MRWLIIDEASTVSLKMLDLLDSYLRRACSRHPFAREGRHDRPFGGMKIERTWFAADKTGFHMLHALFQTTLKYNNITIGFFNFFYLI